MRGVIVDNQMNIQCLIRLCVEFLQEFEKFIVVMLRQTLTNDSYFVNIECCKQSGRSVTLVIVGYGTCFSRLER